MEETEGRRGLGSSVHEQEQEALGKCWPGLHFPGGPVVKTLSSQCKGPGFNP